MTGEEGTYSTIQPKMLVCQC